MVQRATESRDGEWPAREARVSIVYQQLSEGPGEGWLEQLLRLCPGALAAPDAEGTDIIVLHGSTAWAQAWLREGGARDARPRGTLVVLSEWSSKGAALLLRQAADDVVPATIDSDELCARVHAVLRRVHAPSEADGLNVPVRMRRAERKLLEYLRACPGRIVTSKEILDKVFGGMRRSGTSLVRVHVSRLRRRLGSVAALRTVRGAGYLLEDRPGRAGVTERSGHS
jgi:hypothetical protein